MHEEIEVYITKYALTRGILKQKVKVLDSDNMVKTIDCEYVSQYYHKGEWHRTYKSALEKAEDMKIKKIANLKKQLAKMEVLTFA